jgi:hypothetical protein
MSLKAKVYVTTMTAVGMAVLARGLSLWSPNEFARFLCYLVLALPASCLKVRLPGITGTMSMLFIFLLARVADYRSSVHSSPMLVACEGPSETGATCL